MTEEKSIEEVEAEYRATLQKKTDAMKAEQARLDKEAADAQAIKDADEAKTARLDEFKQFAETLGVVKPPDVINIADGELPVVDPVVQEQGKNNKGGSQFNDPRTQKEMDWMDAFLKRNDYGKTEYASADFVHGKGAKEFAYTQSDSGCDTNIAEWKPADVWCNSIWYAAQCGRQLSGIVTYRGCDINAGDGLVVQIRTITKSSMGAALTACECATCETNTLATHSLTLKRYDIYKVECNLDLFSVGPILKEAMIQTMADAFIEGIDALIWTALVASAGQTETLGANAVCEPTEPTDGACCRYAANLYREIIQLEATMRAAGYGKKGFYLVLHPTVALYLKYKEGTNPPPWAQNISMSGNKLVSIGEIKVIEYCGATACTDDSGAKVAVLLDQSRAVGEAYGKRPHLKVDEDPIECDSWKYVMRSYVAVDALDTGAIGHVVNP